MIIPEPADDGKSRLVQDAEDARAVMAMLAAGGAVLASTWKVAEAARLSKVDGIDELVATRNDAVRWLELAKTRCDDRLADRPELGNDHEWVQLRILAEAVVEYASVLSEKLEQIFGRHE